MPVTVYKHSDASAPVLTASMHSMCNVLKACLVNGYGAKAGAGWTLALEDAPNGKAIFKNSSANRFFYVQHNGKFLQSQSVGADFSRYSVRGCASYIDIDTLVGAYPRVGSDNDVHESTKTGVDGILAGTGNSGWMVVADDKSAWLITSGTTGLTGLDAVVGIGEVETLGNNAAALPKAFVWGSSGAFYADSLVPEPNGQLYIERSIGGGTNAVKGVAYSYLLSQFDAEYIPYPNPVTNELNKVPIYIAENKNDPLREVLFGATENWELIYGKFRGIFSTAHQISSAVDYAATRLGLPGATVTVAGRDYFCMSFSRQGQIYKDRIILDLTGPW